MSSRTLSQQPIGQPETLREDAHERTPRRRLQIVCLEQRIAPQVLWSDSITLNEHPVHPDHP